MSEIPVWWLVLSAAFFAITALAFAGMAFVMFRILGIVQSLQPTIANVTKQVEAVSTQVQGIAGTVHGIAERVEGLTEKVHGITDSARGTVESVGSQARGLVAHLDSMATGSSGRFQNASGWISGAMTAYKLWKTWQESKAEQQRRRARYMPVRLDSNGSVRDNEQLHRGVEQSGSSSGS